MSGLYRGMGTRSLALAAYGALALACTGSIGGAGNEDKQAPGATTTTTEPLVCDPANEHVIGLSPLRRLTRTELRNTLRDLFPSKLPVLDIPADSLMDGFDNNEAAQLASPVFVEKWQKAAAAVATAATFTCTDAGCLVDSLVPRLYRRPVTDEERTRFVAFVNAQGSFDTGARMLVEALLQSPSFLYRPEVNATLSGYEVATRLSYLFWQSMPDDVLFEAAKSGALTTREGIEKEARRLIADPRAKAAIADFHRQWLQLDKMTTMSRDKTLFPAFTDQTPAALFDATTKLVDHQFWNGTFDSLLSEPKAFVNDLTAPLYGVAKPNSTTPVLLELNPAQRAGILTHAGFLASKAHEKFDAPILRGVFVLDKFLCAPPPPPPPNVADIPEASGDVPKTTRQRIEQSHAQGGCKNCHDTIHGVGFLFNNYDAVGAWRTKENGIDVDSSGYVKDLGSDIDGNYDSAVALSKQMAKSERVKQCFSRQWFRFAYGRTETSKDACAVQAMVKALDAAKGNMREMLVQMVLADTFRFKGGN
jgi:hypothetical protein